MWIRADRVNLEYFVLVILCKQRLITKTVYVEYVLLIFIQQYDDIIA